MRVDMFGQPVRKKARFLVFHDESQPVANKGLLLIGLLFVNERQLPRVEESLRYWRQNEKYTGEIHFSDLPKSFGGKFGAKARVARHWMRAYEDGLFQDAMFTCLAVNRASRRFDHKRFKDDYHAYNRFTAMAIKAGISYFLKPLGYDEVELTLISDEKGRKSRPEQGLVDNFEEYIPYRVELDNLLAQQSSSQPYPVVRMLPVRAINSAATDVL